MTGSTYVSKGVLLFVDDETSILNSLQRLFSSLDYIVFTALSGQAGLEILEKNQVDIVISDMRMPEMDGTCFLKTVAAKWPQCKRLLLTGYADINSTIAAINDGGIDYYFSKPWKNEHIAKLIEKFVEKKL